MRRQTCGEWLRIRAQRRAARRLRLSSAPATASRSLGLTLACGGTCRADACNHGAARARGDVLLFLHADTLLPNDFVRRIRYTLRRREIVGGAFDFAFAEHLRHRRLDRCKLQMVVWCNHVRYRWSRNFYGDQAIFVRRDVFDKLGGFPQRALMEDVHFSRLMNRHGRTAILSPGVRTSPRRFVMRGVLTQLLIDMVILSCDSFQLNAAQWWQQYNQWNRQLSGTNSAT
jgi:cellulose synthase/poly-beta-1,6-N-acetylglucosamine synthase-like glycosyltransferase